MADKPKSKENQIENFLNAHAERQSAIERDLARTDQRLNGLEEKTETILNGQNVLFSKFDNLMSAVSALKAGNGLVSSHMILTTIGVLTPVIIATAMLGYYFVLQVQDKDRLQFGNVKETAQERYYAARAESDKRATQIQGNIVMIARLEERIVALKESTTKEHKKHPKIQ